MALLLDLLVTGQTRLNDDTYAKDIYADKFIRTGSSDLYVLLGGGGHKLLSDFSMAHNHPYLPLAGGWMDTGAQIYFKGINQSTSVWGSIGYRAYSGNGSNAMHNVTTPNNTGALYITTNGYDSANDYGGLAIDNDGVTAFGAGDSGSVFRVINEDNVTDGAQFYVTKASGAVVKKSLTASNFISNETTGTQPYACTSTTCNTNLNADLLDGYHASCASNTPYGTIPVITTSGYMDVGKHFEFHFDNTTGSDYSTALMCTGNYSNIVNLPSASGTLALTSQIPTVTNYYWANINITSSPDSTKIPTLGGLNTTGVIQSSSSYPVYLTSTGTGVYNKTVIMHSADGLIIERARKTESSSGVIIPLIISQRGGGNAVTFKNNDVLVSGRVESTENYVWESGTKYRVTTYGSQGIGRIYNYNEETTKYGDMYLGCNGANGITIKGDTFNVGIGIGAPSKLLDVNGSAKICGSLSVGHGVPSRPTSGSLGSAQLTIGNFIDGNRDTFYYGTAIWTEGSGTGFIQQGRGDGTASVYPLILQVLGGNVGIGTASPGYKLHVNGDALVNPYIYYTSSSYYSGYFSSGKYLELHNNVGSVGIHLFDDGTIKMYRGGTRYENIDAGNYSSYALPLSGGWIDYAGQIYFKGLNQSTTVYSTIGYRASLGSAMHHASSPHQDNGAFYIGTNGCNSANDWGGLAIDNEGVTVFGAGDTGSVFRVLNEDNVSDGAQFYVTKASGTVSKYTHSISSGLLKVTDNGNTMTIGSQNSGYGHIQNSADIPFYFNKTVYVDGAIWRYNTNYGIASDGYFYAKGVYANRDGSSTDGGVSLYSNTDPMTYGIAFRGTGTYGTHGYVTAADDWATYLTMNDSTTRGWIFRRYNTNVASIAGNGNMAIGQHLKFSNEAHISTNRSTDYHYGYTFNLTANEQSIGMYSGPIGEAGGVVISPDGCLIYNSSDCGYNLQVRDKDLGADLTNIATLTFGIEQSGHYAWSRGGFKKNGSSDSYVLLGAGGHKLESNLSVSYAASAGNADTVDGYHATDLLREFWTSSPGYDGNTHNSSPILTFSYSNNAPYTGVFVDLCSNGYGVMFNTSYYSDTQLAYRRHGTSGDGGMGSWRYLIDNVTIGSQSVNYATSAGNADTVDGYHHSSFAKIADVNNLMHSGNEFTYAAPTYSGDIWHNYRTSSWSTDGGIANYRFGNGAGGYATVVALAFYESSDERLKDFYNSVDVDFDKLSSLPKKFFKWKSNPNGEFEIGTSAQELQKIYPQLVNTDDKGYLTVAYDKLSIIALRAIDKLYEMNKNLERRIQILESKR